MEINDLAGLKDPLTKLVESVSGAIGVLYEPRRIRKKAEADADAMLTLAKGEMEVEELKRRADERVSYTEMRRQKNVERIVEQAAKELPEAVDEKPADEDWIAQFFNLSQDVGDEEMQTLWARILAGEVARPGKFSLRTLQAVKLLSKEDARLFSQYCSYVWQPAGRALCRYTNNETNEYLASRGIRLSERQHLQNLGLIYSGGLMTGSGANTAINSRDEPFEVTYFGRKYLLRQSLNPNESALVFPEFLTDVGGQLFPISGAVPDERYLQLLIESLRKDKLEVSALD
jgi:uncharacterized repeat protein (TIGR03899 family)